jgi:hypothetical protein
MEGPQQKGKESCPTGYIRQQSLKGNEKKKGRKKKTSVSMISRVWSCTSMGGKMETLKSVFLSVTPVN